MLLGFATKALMAFSPTATMQCSLHHSFISRSSPSSANNGEDQSKVEEIKEDLPEDDETDESNSLWLEDLGLDKKKFRALDPERLKLYPLLISSDG